MVNNNKVGIVDANNRLRDELEVSEAFNEDASNEAVFQSLFPHYVNAFVEGVNVSVIFYGSSGSGKEYAMQGAGPQVGIIPLVMNQVYEELEGKKMSNPSFKFEVKIKYTEVLDEKATDLLQQGGSSSFPKSNLKIDEWEGPFIQGINWVPMSNKQQLNSFFDGGNRNKTDR